jgi:acetyl esterase
VSGLDPQARAVLDRMNARRSTSFEMSTASEARRSQFGFADFFGAGAEVERVEHMFVPGPTADLPIRIYRPVGAKSNSPVLVYFHGSGFVVGNIGIFDSPSRTLAARTGCVVVAVNYQKAPEHKFPVPFEDAYAATEWVADHAIELAVDPTRLGVIGDSAGGTLAAATCLKSIADRGPAIALQVLVHAPFQFGTETRSMVEFATGYLLEAAAMRWFGDQYLRSPSDADVPYAAPLRAVSVAGLPPALIVTAEFDPLRDEGEQYGARLQAAGVPTTVHRYQGMIHGFYGMTGTLTAADDLFDEIAGFVGDTFAGQTARPASSSSDRSRTPR